MWRYRIGDEELGPVSEDEMRALAAEGRLTPDTDVQGSHMLGWAPARETALSAFWPEITAEAARVPIDDRPMAGLWAWLRGGLQAYLAASAISLAGLCAEIAAILGMREDAFLSADAAVTVFFFADIVVGFGSLIALIIFVVTVILWLRVTYRAMRNLHRRGAKGLTMSPGWAVGWYFIPIAWLWKPLEGVRIIWRASADPTDPTMVRVPSAIGWWWACWILTNVLGNISFRIALATGQFNAIDTLDYDALLVTTSMDAASSALDITMALLAMWFWGRIARMQDTQYAARLYD